MALGNDVHLIPVRLDALRPTQMTVGYREVKAKRKHWKALNKRARKAAIESHWFPAVLGPDGLHYITDHHHLGLALIEEGEARVNAMLLKDLSWLDDTIFWRMMEHNQWVHPFGPDGSRRDYAHLPKVLTGLEDDPYRSLAGELRRLGGFAKDTTPFSEILWADFFRRRIKRRRVEKNFNAAIEHAMEFAKSEDARYLPGWCGPLDG